MKFDELKSIAHNIADSLASGASLLINRWELEIFEEARRSAEGYITVDFLTGETRGGVPSPPLASAVKLLSDAFTDLCKRHGTTPSDFQALTARYYVDQTGRRFEVTVVNDRGRCSIDVYDGNEARLRVRDPSGRLRPRSA